MTVLMSADRLRMTLPVLSKTRPWASTSPSPSPSMSAMAGASKLLPERLKPEAQSSVPSPCPQTSRSSQPTVQMSGMPSASMSPRATPPVGRKRSPPKLAWLAFIAPVAPSRMTRRPGVLFVNW